MVTCPPEHILPIFVLRKARHGPTSSQKPSLCGAILRPPECRPHGAAAAVGQLAQPVEGVQQASQPEPQLAGGRHGPPAAANTQACKAPLVQGAAAPALSTRVVASVVQGAGLAAGRSTHTVLLRCWTGRGRGARVPCPAMPCAAQPHCDVRTRPKAFVCTACKQHTYRSCVRCAQRAMMHPQAS